MKTTEALKALAALAHDRRLAIYRLRVVRPRGLPSGTGRGALERAGCNAFLSYERASHASMVAARQDGLSFITPLTIPK